MTTDLIQRLRDYGCCNIRKEAADALEQQAAQIAEKDAEIAWLRMLTCKCVENNAAATALRADAEQLRVGHDRYETVRVLSVPQFQDAYVLNRRTGKPFDEIIDDLRLNMRPFDAALSQEQPKPLVEIGRRTTPCGECHLQPGECCDICGARDVSAQPAGEGEK
jgi:hypothetical protein